MEEKIASKNTENILLEQKKILEKQGPSLLYFGS